LPVASGLVAESTAYSMLLAGAEFARWRRARPVRVAPPPGDEPVLVRREGDVLDVRINRPERHNAFDRFVRDGLADAFDRALADPSIVEIHLSGNGPSFCSGGDLDEFGTSADVTTAHLVRLDRSVAARVHRRRAATRVRLHGGCIGAGIEIPSFAGHVTATPDAFFQLPELAMGLVPGAGGTVGITRRIGRWRTAYLGLTGERIDRTRALEWGLVDAGTD
jgi:enoyl-CoA hydratase/carnithine racemase